MIIAYLYISLFEKILFMAILAEGARLKLDTVGGKIKFFKKVEKKLQGVSKKRPERYLIIAHLLKHPLKK